MVLIRTPEWCRWTDLVGDVHQPAVVRRQGPEVWCQGECQDHSRGSSRFAIWPVRTSCCHHHHGHVLSGTMQRQCCQPRYLPEQRQRMPSSILNGHASGGESLVWEVRAIELLHRRVRRWAFAAETCYYAIWIPSENGEELREGA